MRFWRHVPLERHLAVLGARCVLICHKSVRFLQTCLAGYLCVSIQLVTHNHACRVVTHSATTPLDKYMLFLRAWESCQSIQPVFLFRKHSRSVGILMRNCGSWFLAIGESRQALQASTFSKQFCVDICQRLLEQLVLTDGCLEAAFGVGACECYTQRDGGVVRAFVLGVHVFLHGSIDARVFAASQIRHPS